MFGDSVQFFLFQIMNDSSHDLTCDDSSTLDGDYVPPSQLTETSSSVVEYSEPYLNISLESLGEVDFHVTTSGAERSSNKPTANLQDKTGNERLVTSLSNDLELPQSDDTCAQNRYVTEYY